MTEISLPDAAAEMNPSDKLVLFVLITADEPLTRSDLVEETQINDSTLHYALDRLIEAGLATRRPNASDARGYLYTSTT